MPAFRKILEGYSKFREEAARDHPDLFRMLAAEQRPRAMMISCCDSRVDPALITHADPGDLFILRNVANIVPPRGARDDGHHGTSAALEYAVFALRVDYIIVMGHAGCGGIRALMTDDPEVGPGREFIHPWIGIAVPARNRIERMYHDLPFEEQVRRCELENVKVSLDNLMSFQWIRERVQADTLRLEGLYFDISEGTLYRYEPHLDDFTRIGVEAVGGVATASEAAAGE